MLGWCLFVASEETALTFAREQFFRLDKVLKQTSFHCPHAEKLASAQIFL